MQQQQQQQLPGLRQEPTQPDMKQEITAQSVTCICLTRTASFGEVLLNCARKTDSAPCARYLQLPMSHTEQLLVDGSDLRLWLGPTLSQ